MASRQSGSGAEPTPESTFPLSPAGSAQSTLPLMWASLYRVLILFKKKKKKNLFFVNSSRLLVFNHGLIKFAVLVNRSDRRTGHGRLRLSGLTFQ